MGTRKSEAELLQDAIDEQRHLQRELATARQALRVLRREHDTAERIREEIYKIAAHSPQAPKWIKPTSITTGSRGAPLLVVSDVHYGEDIKKNQISNLNEFNPDIAEKRLSRLAHTTIDLSERHMGRAGVPYPGIVVCFGGDMIGGDIHEELFMTNSKTPQQSVNELTDILAAFLITLKKAFGKVFVPCVVGNHGRGTKKPFAKSAVYTSFDWLIYCNLERYFADDPSIQFLIPPAVDAHFTMFGHNFLLTHGDRLGVKGGDGIIGALGPIARGLVKLGNAEHHLGREFDFCIMGHWHELYYLPRAIVNGCVKGYDEYAALVLRARYEPPTQALVFVHPQYGITARWSVYLEGHKKASNGKKWVSWEA